MKTILCLLYILAFAGSADADATVTFAWEANPEPLGSLTYTLEARKNTDEWTAIVSDIPHTAVPQPWHADIGHPWTVDDGFRASATLATGRWQVQAFAVAGTLSSLPSNVVEVTVLPAPIAVTGATTTAVTWTASAELGVTYSLVTAAAEAGPFTAGATGPLVNAAGHYTAPATLAVGSWVAVLATDSASGLASQPLPVQVKPSAPKALIRVSMQASPDAQTWTTVAVAEREPAGREFFRLVVEVPPD